jgi:hypothetical protein
MWTTFKLWAAGANWLRIGLIALAALSFAASVYFWIYNKGHAAATTACATGALAVNEKAGKDHAKTETEIYTLDDRRLYDELSRWMR